MFTILVFVCIRNGQNLGEALYCSPFFLLRRVKRNLKLLFADLSNHVRCFVELMLNILVSEGVVDKLRNCVFALSGLLVAQETINSVCILS